MDEPEVEHDLGDAVLGGTPSTSDEGERPTAGAYAKRVVWVVLAAFAVLLLITQSKARSTLVTVAIGVGASGAIWIGANLLFNQVRERWQRFSAIAGALVGALVGIIIHGNRLTLGSGEGFLTWVVGPVVGAAIGGGLGLALAGIDEPSRRLATGLGAGVGIGVGIGLVMRDTQHPGLDPAAIAVWTAIGVAVGAGLSALRRRPPLGGALIGGALGWILGAWGGANLGDGSIATSVIAAVVPAALLGARLGLTPNLDTAARVRADNRSRAVIFVGPAVLFISAMLVIPALRTGYLSLLDRNSEDFLWLENYGAIFTDRVSFDGSNWTAIFTSRLTWVGAALLVAFAIIGTRTKQRTGRLVEVGSVSSGPLIAGLFFVAFGVFTVLRGTLINNLWWVITVTFASTAIGLAIAVLADNMRGERFAKSIIFMPMAISLVGASIIWRFVYQARNVTNEQTGIINAVWVSLGKLSTGSGLPTLIGSVLLGVATVGAIAWLGRSLVRRNTAGATVAGVVTLGVGWFFLRFVGVLGDGIGGFVIRDDGTIAGDTILFFERSPFNNFWLMVILIWIQAGFAMVILSSAIKAVPTELIEAARIDGATESQVFWRVTLPQIATTIGVVVTTLIVVVMKVFDIVKVTTNGQFDTQVLANDMFQKAFNDGDTGQGAALALLIFFSVLPVMIFNIRNMQKEG